MGSAAPPVDRHQEQLAVPAHSVARPAVSTTGRGLSLEQVTWILLLLAAAISRFWNLDTGPFTTTKPSTPTIRGSSRSGTYRTATIPSPTVRSCFSNALVYFLFGGSDATSRFLPATAGVLLVGAPWLLRGSRHLGRWGALAAAFMLLISPSFLYYTRYIRHDPYTCLGAIVLSIAIFRYLERPQRRWMFLAFFSVAFMLTNHEIVFAILLVFVAVLFGALLWGALRPLVPVCLARGGRGHPACWRPGVSLDWPPLARNSLGKSNPGRSNPPTTGICFQNPFVIGALLIGILFVVAAFWGCGPRSGHGPPARLPGGDLR